MAVRKSELTGEALRLALLDAAGLLLAAEGAHALSVRRLADAVGTSTQSIYTQFGGKEGIVRAMYREGFARLGEHLAAAAASTDDALEALRALGRAYRESAYERPHLYHVMFGRPVAEFSADDGDLVACLATLAMLTDGVRRAIDAGALEGDAEQIAMHLWFCVHGFVSLELAGYLPGPNAALALRYDQLLAESVTPFLLTL